ncbi:hypothetical protein JCM5353_001723 [Sporobolomyces roseus]
MDERDGIHESDLSIDVSNMFEDTVRFSEPTSVAAKVSDAADRIPKTGCSPLDLCSTALSVSTSTTRIWQKKKGHEYLVKRESDLALQQLIVQFQKHCELVNGINVTFEVLPPRHVDASQIIDTLYRVQDLEKIWLLDEGVDFWADLKPAKPSDDVLSRFSDALIRHHKSSLKVLIIPQISLRPIDMHHIFTGLESLEIHKGTINAPRPFPPHFSHARLHRLYVTRFLDGNDLRFLLVNSLNTLRYLHLVVTPEQYLVELCDFQQLETLAITINCWTEIQYDLAFASPTAAFALKAKKDLKVMFASILGVIDSTRGLRNLKSLSIFPSFTDYFVADEFWRVLFRRLPSAIQHLAIGPGVTTELTWSLLLANRSAYPSLKRLTLTSPPTSKDSRNSTRLYFVTEHLSHLHGIEVDWIKTTTEWWTWKERQFYPAGSKEQLQNPGFHRMLHEFESRDFSKDCMMS